MRNHRVELSLFAGLGGNRVGMALLGPALALVLAGCPGLLDPTPQQREAERAVLDAKVERTARLIAACGAACGGGGMDRIVWDGWTGAPLCNCRRPEAPSPRQDGSGR